VVILLSDILLPGHQPHDREIDRMGRLVWCQKPLLLLCEGVIEGECFEIETLESRTLRRVIRRDWAAKESRVPDINIPCWANLISRRSAGVR